MQRCRDGGVARLQDGFGELFDEQGDAVGPGDDCVHHLRRQAVSRAQRLDDGLDPAPSQPVEGQPGDVRMGGELRLMIRAAGEHDEHPGIPDPVEGLLQHLESRRVDPVSIFQRHEDRLISREGEQLIDERDQRHDALLLRGQVERLLVFDADQAGEQGERVVCAIGGAQHGSEFGALRFHRVVPEDPGRSGDLLGHRPESRVRVIGGAVVANPGMRPGRQLIEHRTDDA